jgi:hypothetical protein
VPEGPPHGDEKDKGVSAVPGDSGGDYKGEGCASSASGRSDGDDQEIGTSISRGAAPVAPELPINHRHGRFVEEALLEDG